MRIILLLIIFPLVAMGLPLDFVYLRQIDPTIVQEMRYHSEHNFVGRVIHGYERSECILTRPAALALHKVQQQLLAHQLSLKVYDCYRPVAAVTDFWQWSQDPHNQLMKKEFYPREDKTQLFAQGYIAKHSGHSRGSTVDLTIVSLPLKSSAKYVKGQALKPCIAPYRQRFADNSINMGSGYDCLDPQAWVDSDAISSGAHANRLLLQELMQQAGFDPYAKEWWHFTLHHEPYPKQYFVFPVR